MYRTLMFPWNKIEIIRRKIPVTKISTFASIQVRKLLQLDAN